ncbi:MULTISPECIES: Lrp/AsnC family transcriptional regulator [Pseudomonas]|nr:Lrp/AsnC family transcriptional regulator [Pseudomonas gingeri]
MSRVMNEAPPVLDRIDAAILDILRDEGRITYQELSERVHLTPRPCLERVRKLEKLGVIRGYGAMIDLPRLSPGVSLLVMVALSNQNGRTAQRAFEAKMRESREVIECQLVSGAFDYCLRMHCRDLEHYRVLTEQWFNDVELHIDRLVSHPTLASVKQSVVPASAFLP